MNDNNNMKLTIDDIINKCEKVLRTEPKDSDTYNESYEIRKLLLDYIDLQDNFKYQLGEKIWVMFGDEDKNETLYYSDYIFLSTCGDYIIATKYDNEYKDDIRKQLAIMSIQSFTNSCDNIKLLHKRRIFKTEEEVKKLIEEIKEKNNEQFIFENEE